MLRIKGKKNTAFDRTVAVILLAVGFAAIYPVYLVIIASLSDPTYIGNGQVLIIPLGLNISAYKGLIANSKIWTGYRNSLLYMVFGTMLNLAVTLPAAYTLSRKGLPARKWLMLVFLFTMYFNGGIIPTYLAVRSYGLINKPWVLVLAPALNVFNLIIARSYFESSIPDAVYESANIDGASNTRFFIQMALPLSLPMIAVLTLYYGLSHWNSYFHAMIYISNPNYQTLQVIIREITAQLDYSIQETMTASEIAEKIQSTQLTRYAIVVVSILPVLILYPFIQRFFIKGIMIGAIKG